MYITFQTMIYAFKAGTYIHTAHTIWSVYTICKKSMAKCKNVYTSIMGK